MQTASDSDDEQPQHSVQTESDSDDEVKQSEKPKSVFERFKVLLMLV